MISLPRNCRYCNCTDENTDLYLVIRNGALEAFCLPCYEKHLDDKRIVLDGDVH